MIRYTANTVITLTASSGSKIFFTTYPKLLPPDAERRATPPVTLRASKNGSEAAVAVTGFTEVNAFTVTDEK